MKKTIWFTECEHEGDMRNYIDDLYECGAVVVSSKLNSDAETCEIVVDFASEEKKDKFLETFKETDSYGFSSLNNN